MHSLAVKAQAFAEGLGGPGLTAVAFVDASFLTLPEVADILVVLFSVRSPGDWLYFALMTTTGSVIGSYVLFAIGLKGGEALLRRRFHERHIDRGLAWFRRFGVWMIVFPAMLPPPTPFKLLVLLSGVAGLNRTRFVLAVAVGRGVRYGTEAYLATLYGEGVLKFLQENAFRWVLPIVATVVGILLTWLIWRRATRRRRAVVPANEPRE